MHRVSLRPSFSGNGPRLICALYVGPCKLRMFSFRRPPVSPFFLAPSMFRRSLEVYFVFISAPSVFLAPEMLGHPLEDCFIMTPLVFSFFQLAECWAVCSKCVFISTPSFFFLAPSMLGRLIDHFFLPKPPVSWLFLCHLQRWDVCLKNVLLRRPPSFSCQFVGF